MAEALAMKLGFQLAMEIGCNKLIAESDSSETIEACTGKKRWWNKSTVNFADCVDLIPSIGTVSFKFCPREANYVAHEIARFCFSNNTLVIGSMNPLAFFSIVSQTM
jgi:ribonuclease HI